MSNDVVGEDIQKVDFRGLLQQINLHLIVPTRDAQPPGKYQWPVGPYTLDVGFPDNAKDPTVVLAILNDADKQVSVCSLDTITPSVHAISYPSSYEITQLIFCFKELLGSIESYRNRCTGQIAQVEPPMVVVTNNTPDINDDWVKWFCGRNPGTSYAKAIHVAITHMNTEIRKLKTITDRYINRP